MKELTFTLFLSIILFSGSSIAAQNVENQETKEIYAFMDTSKNHILFPAGDVSFTRFYQKMDSLVFDGKGQVNILHLGGSHIQADVFSNRVRENLVKFYPGFAASRGFVFPFSVAKTNTPSSYASSYKGRWDMSKSVLKNITKPLGLLGIAASTEDSAAEVTILLNKYNSAPIWFYRHVRIFGYSENGSVEPLLKLDSSHFLRGIRDPENDSYLYNLDFPKDSLVIVFEWKNTIPSNSGRPNPTFTLTGILLTNDTPGISYSSIGINGANVPAYLACKNLERDLKFLKPDLLILSIGLNDANVDDFDEKLFRAHYDTLISRIKSVAPQVAILFTTNNDSYRRDKQKNFLLHPNGEIARQAFFTMATQYHAGIWDMFSLMGGLGSMEQWEKADLAKNDRVHFNYAGYNLLGNFFYQALMEAYTHHIAKLKAEEPPQ